MNANAGVTLVRWSSRGPLHRGGIQRVQSNVRWLGVVSAGLALFFAGCCGDLRETRLGTGTMIKQAGKNSGEIMRTTTMGSAYGVSDDIVQRDLQEIIKGFNRTNIMSPESNPYDPNLLVTSAIAGDVEACESLLARRADPNLPTLSKTTALCQAAFYGRQEVVEILLDNGAEADLPDGEGFSPLLLAVIRGHNGIVELLLENNANPDYQEEQDGYSPLYAAVAHKNTQAAILLLDKGADPNRQTSNGQTPIWLAAIQGDITMLRWLIKRHPRLDIPDDEGFPPLFAAAHCKDSKLRLAAVSFLLDNGAAINQKGPVGRSICAMCVELGHHPLLQFVISKGADPHAADKYGITPLFVAVFKRDHEILEYLLNKQHVDPNKMNKKKHTALMASVQGGDGLACEILLDYGADPNVQNMNGDFALMMAISKGFTKIAKMLLTHKKNKR
mmetsp:Transcript_6673/g.10303  ORF Transcript_6673/g.10303 Transcript_6673/m.10303 type:complete len:445 (-) Transcript_6673:313-1647(-)